MALTANPTATPALLPTVGAIEPRRLARYAGFGGFPLRARTQALLGIPLAGQGAYLVTIALRQVAGERVPGVHAGPAVMLALAVGFGGLGLWLLAGAGGVLATRLGVARRRRRFPDQPWLADYPWERRGGRDLVPRELPRALAFAAVVVAFATIFAWAGFVADAGAPFQVAGGLLVVGAVAATVRALGIALRLLRRGRSRLRFAAFPSAPGDTIELILDDLAPGVRTLPLRATLRGVQERWESAAVADRTRNRRVELAHWELWRETQPVAPGARSVRFTLPAGAPGTVLAVRPARWWELELVVAEPHAEWRARFLVPVYASA